MRAKLSGFVAGPVVELDGGSSDRIHTDRIESETALGNKLDTCTLDFSGELGAPWQSSP